MWNFHKIINIPNTSISKNHHLVSEIIICYKKLSFGINISSYLIRCFQNFLEEILTHNFLGIEVALKLSLFAHWRWCWGPFERKVLTHYSCCWGPLWKEGRLTH